METPATPPPGDRETWDHIATQAVRGPLSWIITHLDAMDSDVASQFSPASKKALGNARSASKRLLDMLESLLASQRIQTGLEPAAPAPVSLTAALEPVVKQLAARATAEGKSYTFNAESLGLAASANEDLLRRAVRLASNRALDEAQRGGNVRVTASGMSGGVTRIRIQATPPAEDSGQVGQVVPAEIGFARLAVEQMGGKFTAARTPEQGLLVDMVLPVPAARPAETAPSAPPARPVEAAPSAPSRTEAMVAAAPEPVRDELPAGPVGLKIERQSASKAAEPDPGPAHEPVPEEPHSSGFKITREVTFDWGPEK